jgi:transcriptional regulator with XRE-family HTH domain
MSMPTLGEFIQRRRVELGLTQEQLAELVGGGVRQAEISRLEHDRVTLPRRQRLEQISRALDVPLGELLARSGWVGAEAIGTASVPADNEVDLLQARNDELEVRAEQLESTVDILAATNVDLRSQVVQLESDARRTEREQEFLKSVLDGVTDPVVVVGERGEVVAENAAFIDLRNGHDGMTRIMTPDGHPIVGALGSFRPSDQEADFSTTIIVANDDDARSWHEVHVKPMSLEGGDRISVITVKECAEPE